MNLIRISAPATLPVTLEEAREYLRVRNTALDGLIESLIRSVTDSLDGADGLLGRCLVEQTWLLKIDSCFPRVIEVPLPPLIRVESVSYINTDGEAMTLDPGAYQVAGIQASVKAEISPAFGTTWPETRRAREAISITFTAGYSDSQSPSLPAVPEALKGAILETVATRFEFPEAAVAGDAVALVPVRASSVFDNFRVWNFG